MRSTVVEPATIDLARLERDLTAAALAAAHPLVRRWLADRLETAVAARMSRVVAGLTDDAAAEAYAETMRALAVPAHHFRMHLIEAGDIRILARIDFADVTGAGAFVEVHAASVPPGTIADAATFAAIGEAFAVFVPGSVEIFHAAHLPLRAPATRIAQHLLAAPVREMLARPAAPGLDRVALARPADLAFYPRYRETYEAMWAERPHLRDVVRIESEETLAACREQGLLFEILVDGLARGVVAARNDARADIRGIFMVEIVLDRATRAQGLGPAVHQRLAAAVAAASSDAIVIGTIAPENVPSLKTATRAGRVEIGTWRRVAI